MSDKLSPLDDQALSALVADNQDKLVILKFFANWCSHCRDFAPTWEKIVSSNQQVVSGKVAMGQSDVDLAPSSANTWQVEVLPSIIFIKNGKEVERLIGNQSQEVMETLIKKYA